MEQKMDDTICATYDYEEIEIKEEPEWEESDVQVSDHSKLTQSESSVSQTECEPCDEIVKCESNFDVFSGVEHVEEMTCEPSRDIVHKSTDNSETEYEEIIDDTETDCSYEQKYGLENFLIYCASDESSTDGMENSDIGSHHGVSPNQSRSDDCNVLTAKPQELLHADLPHPEKVIHLPHPEKVIHLPHPEKVIQAASKQSVLTIQSSEKPVVETIIRMKSMINRLNSKLPYNMYNIAKKGHDFSPFVINITPDDKSPDDKSKKTETIGQYMDKKRHKFSPFVINITPDDKSQKSVGTCSLCNTDFHFKDEMRSHQLVTSDERHECNFCNKRFNSLCVHGIHMRTHASLFENRPSGNDRADVRKLRERIKTRSVDEGARISAINAGIRIKRIFAGIDISEIMDVRIELERIDGSNVRNIKERVDIKKRKRPYCSKQNGKHPNCSEQKWQSLFRQLKPPLQEAE